MSDNFWIVTLQNKWVKVLITRSGGREGFIKCLLGISVPIFSLKIPSSHSPRNEVSHMIRSILCWKGETTNPLPLFSSLISTPKPITHFCLQQAWSADHPYTFPPHPSSHPFSTLWLRCSYLFLLDPLIVLSPGAVALRSICSTHLNPTITGPSSMFP